MPRRDASPSARDRSIAGVLRSAVLDSGESTFALASRAGLDRGMVGRFARGERDLSLQSAGRLAAALGLSLRPDERRRGRPRAAPAAADADAEETDFELVEEG